MKKSKGITRRDFIKGATVAGAGLVGAGGVLNCQDNTQKPIPTQKKQPVQAEPTTSNSTVVLIRNPKIMEKNGQINTSVLTEMMNQAMASLFDKTSDQEAWAQLFSADDTVGIKTNVWRFLATPKELEELLVQKVIGCGVKADRIAVDDRGVLTNPVFQKASALINVRPLRTHHWSGVGSCIKNYIPFVEKPWEWHGDSCADLAGLWDLPQTKGKTRLNILVMLTPLFYGKGPHHFQANYTWDYHGLLLSQDPVAVDATGLRILEAKRRAHFGKSVPLATPAKHIVVAQQKHKLGAADPKRIKLIKLGDQEGSLI
jgi:hypothetical protein